MPNGVLCQAYSTHAPYYTSRQCYGYEQRGNGHISFSFFHLIRCSSNARTSGGENSSAFSKSPFVKVNTTDLGNFMLPKRRFWMAKRTFGNAFSKYFSGSMKFIIKMMIKFYLIYLLFRDKCFHVLITNCRYLTRPPKSRIPIVRFVIQTAFRARMNICKSGISGLHRHKWFNRRWVGQTQNAPDTVLYV
jgi:hypothetical protein